MDNQVCESRGVPDACLFTLHNQWPASTPVIASHHIKVHGSRWHFLLDLALLLLLSSTLEDAKRDLWNPGYWGDGLRTCRGRRPAVEPRQPFRSLSASELPFDPLADLLPSRSGGGGMRSRLASPCSSEDCGIEKLLVGRRLVGEQVSNIQRTFGLSQPSQWPGGVQPAARTRSA